MAIAASGAVSFGDLRTEFVGGSSAISLSDLYRGGSNILTKAGDNPAVNLAASVPTSGTIDIGDFHSTAKGFKSTISSTTTNLVCNTLFGDDYDVNYPKIISINAGVTIGGVSSEALTIPSGLAGTLVINNAGNIYGAGGVANGGDGRVAVFNQSSGVTINNTGEIRGGGGGGGIGGTGGTGGQGSYTTVSYAYGHGSRSWWCYSTCTSPGDCGVIYGGTHGRPIPNATTQYGNYYKGSYYQYGGSCQAGYQLGIGSTAYSSGGAGGAGGTPPVGQGYNQAAGTGGAGSAGASGSNNSGAGGTGGTAGNGGAWATAGQAGATGNTGVNGNYSNGAGGAGGGAGGAAGAAVSGTSVTMNNTGTISGTVA